MQPNQHEIKCKFLTLRLKWPTAREKKLMKFKFFALLCLLFNLEQILRRLKQEPKMKSRTEREQTKTENGTLTMFRSLFVYIFGGFCSPDIAGMWRMFDSFFSLSLISAEVSYTKFLSGLNFLCISVRWMRIKMPLKVLCEFLTYKGHRKVFTESEPWSFRLTWLSGDFWLTMIDERAFDSCTLRSAASQMTILLLILLPLLLLL